MTKDAQRPKRVLLIAPDARTLMITAVRFLDNPEGVLCFDVHGVRKFHGGEVSAISRHPLPTDGYPTLVATTVEEAVRSPVVHRQSASGWDLVLVDSADCVKMAPGVAA